MDGSQPVVQVLDSGNLPTLSFPSLHTRASVVSRSLPSLDAGFRHPCRNDGPPTLVYNDEARRSGNIFDRCPTIECRAQRKDTRPTYTATRLDLQIPLSPPFAKGEVMALRNINY